MTGTIYRFGDLAVSGATLLAGGAALLFAILLVITFFAWRRAARRVELLEDTRHDGIEAGLAELRRHQGEITGHVRGLSERLDGFGHRVGQSMSETARGTHESLAKLGERLAVIDAAQKPALRHGRGDGVAEGHPRQQADARRLRPGPHGDHRARRPAAGRLYFQADADQQVAAGLRDPPAGRSAPLVVDANSRWRGSPNSAAPATTRAEARGATRARRRHPACRRHRGEISGPRRDPGRGADVRALGIDLRRPRRAFRGCRAARAPGAGGDRFAVADDDGDPGRAGRAARRALREQAH